ncbi:hypothetical protein MTR67_023217 [Solanum verrucosum]|uniref:Tf2-1-like SH3-like domain-containing protein n=1 Tax=Solanum verrucosum TaxID=315347 RepID=A0AAF0QT36_SOLVR|nr:hypothetical protein MTR67_023217 [Solanum verrucosum]
MGSSLGSLEGQWATHQADRGPQFTSHFWKSFLKGLGTQVNLSTIFHLQMDGQALYGRRCRSLVGWFELGEVALIGHDSVHNAMEILQLIRDRLKIAQSHQKSYVDVRRRDLEFQVDEMVFLQVSPMKGVMRFGKKGKLILRYVGPYSTLKRVGKLSYKLELSA